MLQCVNVDTRTVICGDAFIARRFNYFYNREIGLGGVIAMKQCGSQSDTSSATLTSFADGEDIIYLCVKIVAHHYHGAHCNIRYLL